MYGTSPPPLACSRPAGRRAASSASSSLVTSISQRDMVFAALASSSGSASAENLAPLGFSGLDDFRGLLLMVVLLESQRGPQAPLRMVVLRYYAASPKFSEASE